YEGFSALGNYEDAQQRAENILYEYVLILLDEGKEEEAIEQLGKLSGYEDEKEELINQQRYKRGINYYEQENYTQAINEFTQIQDYEDSQKYIVEAQMKIGNQAFIDGDYQKAIEIFEALEEEPLAEEKAREGKYFLALEKIRTEEYEEAIELLSEIENYEDAKDQITIARYQYANTLLNGKFYKKAAEIFSELGEYEDASLKAKQCYYALGVEEKMNQNFVEAGAYFALAEDFEDAKVLSEKAYSDYFSDAYEKTESLMTEEKYKEVVDLLQELDVENAPNEYKDLQNYYNEANYILANQLYNEGYPYEALIYYRNIPNYKDVSSSKLQRNAYLIIGTWKSDAGMIMEFNEDGTYKIDEEQGLYSVKQYSMLMGESQDEMELTYKVTRLVGDSLTLRYVKEEKDTIYRLVRQK
ncbi:MAG: hypothetical protein GX786_05010, partial [Clostridiales bacterium]|nr:hypothetical protein [Clostridiales bacterium]